MTIEINAVDLEWKGRYGGGGGDSGGGGTGLSATDVRGMINAAISGVQTITMEQVQEAIKAAGTAAVDPAQIQELVNNAVAGIDAGVSAEDVQRMIQEAGTGGSVDVPWKEIQIGYVSRDSIHAYNGGNIANSTNFRVPFSKAFSQPPIVIARGDMNGLRFDVQMYGGTSEYFIMQSNYGADVMGVHFIAFVPKG